MKKTSKTVTFEDVEYAWYMMNIAAHYSGDLYIRKLHEYKRVRNSWLYKLYTMK